MIKNIYAIPLLTLINWLLFIQNYRVLSIKPLPVYFQRGFANELNQLWCQHRQNIDVASSSEEYIGQERKRH